MVNDVIVNLKFDADVLSTVVASLSIVVGIFIGFYQILNSRKLAKLESNLKNKGRIFEDKYSKTMVVLEKMGLLKNTTQKFVIFYNNLEKLCFNQEALANFMILYNEYIDARNDFFDYTAIRRYWIEDELMEIIERLKKPTEDVYIELDKLTGVLNKVIAFKSRNGDIGYLDLLKDYNSCKVDKLLNLINESMVDFENACLKKFQLK